MTDLDIIALVAAIWVIGVVIAKMVSDDCPFTWYERFAFCVLWPLTLVLYGIHWVHNNLLR